MLETHHLRPRIARARVARIVVALAIGLCSAGRSDTFLVGSGAGCTHTLASAFAGAAASAGGDTIVIGESLTWTGAAALTLTNEAGVTIRGAVSCTNTSPAIRNISMTAGDLFAFNNTDASLRELLIISVDPGGGRPVAANGTSLVVLESNVTLSSGSALHGGNVYLTGGASLVALAGTAVYLGAATSNGGGVYCDGGGTVAIGAQASVHGNAAGGNGGGIYATGACIVNVLAGGPEPTAPLYGVHDNDAELAGGGIYASGGAWVTINGSSTVPATLSGNTADVYGGGLYLTGAGTLANVLSAEVVGNTALLNGGGGAFYVGSGAELHVEGDTAGCARGVRCSLLQGNAAGQTSYGGAVRVAAGGSAEILTTFVTGSTAYGGTGAVALVEGAGATLLAEGDVFHDNDPRGPHFLARDGGQITIAYSSFWGSSTPGFGMYLLQAGANGTVELFSTIAIEGQGSAPTGGGPDKIFGPPGAGASQIADCVIAHEIGSFPPAGEGRMVETDPAAVWIAPAAGDPHLLPDAAAIDYCDTFYYTPVADDIDLEARGIDAPPPNGFGFFDLGADEWHPGSAGPIFADGFESGDTSAWSATVP